MRVLILGGGGREHALAWKISQSPRLTTLYCAPGNPGTAQVAENRPVKVDDPAAVLDLAKSLRIDLVVVGPEAPLVAGVGDRLRAAGILVFGPDAQGAAIEGSKAFAKEVMARAGVPTAQTRTFEEPQEAVAFVEKHGPRVVKADGLAQGKGVVVPRTTEDAVRAIFELEALGAAARTLLLEEILEGEEISLIALCDGERYALLPPAQDHKRVGEGDTGPNTGGMGAYAPAPFLSEQELVQVGQLAIGPVLQELKRRGTSFRGALFAGLMLTRGGPRVLEFNCRLGDPETQVLMLQLEEDVLPLLHACAAGRLERSSVRTHRGASVGVVMACDGYPARPVLGDEISGLSNPRAGSVIFHAGTRLEGEMLLTAGGRVLTVCARGESLGSARQAAYATAAAVAFRGAHFRRDIGARALQIRGT